MRHPANFLCFLPLLLGALLAGDRARGAEAAQLSPRERDQRVVERLRAGGHCVASPEVVLCAAPGALAPDVRRDFHALVSAGARCVRRELGKQLDLPGDDRRPVEIFIANDVGIPHVTILHEPWIFMHPEVIARGVAPYLHELVHAMAQWSWRRSEWIAEGFADHAAAAIARDCGGYHRSLVLPDGLSTLQALRVSEAGREMRSLIGLPGRRVNYRGDDAARFARLMADRRRYAPAYYAQSWSFVDHLVERIGVRGLRRLAEADAPSDELVELSGRSMVEHLEDWQRTLESGPASPRTRRAGDAATRGSPP